MFEEKEGICDALLFARSDNLIHNADAFCVRDAAELEEIEDHCVMKKPGLGGRASGFT